MNGSKGHDGRNISNALSKGKNNCCSQSTATIFEREAGPSSESLGTLMHPKCSTFLSFSTALPWESIFFSLVEVRETSDIAEAEESSVTGVINRRRLGLCLL